MKKILIFEYITGGGLIEKKVDDSLLFEAQFILNSLINSRNYQIDFFCDYRHSYKNKRGAIIVSKDNSGILYSSDFINKYDYYLPICPESHMIYYNYVKKITPDVNNINLSCTKTLSMTSDKLAFKEICNKNNLPNPDLFDFNRINNLYVEKDRIGCGCANTRLVKYNQTHKKDKIIEKYIPGESYSVSLHVSPKSYYIMSINKQIMQKNNNYIKLKALLVNIYPSFRNHLYNFIDDVMKVFPNLRGFVGLDFIEYKGELFLIEINARYTTSMSLMERCKRKNPLDYIYNRANNLAGKSCRLELI